METSKSLEIEDFKNLNVKEIFFLTDFYNPNF